MSSYPIRPTFTIDLRSPSGVLSVTRQGGTVMIDVPVSPAQFFAAMEALMPGASATVQAAVLSDPGDPTNRAFRQTKFVTSGCELLTFVTRDARPDQRSGDEPSRPRHPPEQVNGPMLRLIPQALTVLALLTSSVAAQSFTLPELGLQNAGNCRQLAARDRTSNAMIALGCLDTIGKGWNLTPKVIQLQGSGSTGDVSGMSAIPSSSAASGTLARLIADRVTSASPTFTGIGQFGASPYPFAQNSVTTTGAATSGSTALTVSNAATVNVGDMIVAKGVPNDTQVSAISGNTITMTKAATASGTNVAVRFGADRWDPTASAVVNTLGAQNVYVGSAARGRSTMLAQMGAGGHDYPQVSALTVINPYGGISATFANRMSDENTGLGAIITEEVLTDVDSMPTAKNSWSRYTQGITRSSVPGYHLGEESSVANFWPTTDVDPWNVNPQGRVIVKRYDSGIGPGPGAIYGTPNPVSAFMDMVNNGGSARVGINVGVGGLDTTNGRIAPLALMPPKVSLTWNSQANTKAWDIYSSQTGPNANPQSLNLRAGEALFGSGAEMGVGIAGGAGSQRSLNIYTGGFQRWGVSATSTAESGGNVGSDFAISRWSDAGTYVDLPFSIIRSTGQTQISNIAATGGTISGTSIVLRSYTVSSLPTCNAAAKGTMVMATDVSAAPTYRQTGLTGGGSTAVPVFCNGSAYEAH